MAKRMKVATVVRPQDGDGTATHVVFSPGDEVPEWAASQMGDHCFEDEPSGAAKKPAPKSASK